MSVANSMTYPTIMEIYDMLWSNYLSLCLCDGHEIKDEVNRLDHYWLHYL